MKKKFPKQVFISGIGTGVGKTLVSAVLVEALKADYWKPLQCGNLYNSDTLYVQALVSNSTSKFHPETYRLKLPASPHFAAKQEGVTIEMNRIQAPSHQNILVIEGAGGLMVPLNERNVVADLIVQLNVPLILVVRNYLGSINHTLLSIEYLKSKKIELLGLIYSGENFNDNEEVIHNFFGVPVIGHIAETDKPDIAFVSEQAKALRSSLQSFFDF